MFALTTLALTISALSSALPAVAKRQSCSPPSTFTIEQFGIFTPSAGNPHPPNLVFVFGDENYRTECNSSVISNPTTPIACQNSSVEYLWDGNNTLTIGRTYIDCNSSTPVFTTGSLFISLDCIPSIVPFGDGTLCEDPIGDLAGRFTRDSSSL